MPERKAFERSHSSDNPRPGGLKPVSDTGGQQTLGRRAFAVAALAALCVHLAAGAACAAQPKAAVEGTLKADLKAKIIEAIGDSDRPITSRFEARRRAREAADNAEAVLRSEGYYAGEVEPTVTDSEPSQPRVTVKPGRRFKIADPQINWVETPPAEAVQHAAEAVMGLADGQTGRAADVLSAEGRIVAAVQKRGYADVYAAPRTVVVDHTDRSVRPYFKIAAGDLVHLGALSLQGSSKTDPAWIRKLAPWSPGEVYDPADVGDLERRLLDTGVYDSVTVALAPRDQTDADGLRPVILSLSDRADRRLELGASYSTSEGAGGDARWTRYNQLHRGDTTSIFTRASTLDTRIGVDLSLPHWRRARQTLKTSAFVYQQLTAAFQETGIGANADLTRKFERTSYMSLGASVDYSRTRAVTAGSLARLGSSQITAALLGTLSWDQSDDPLDPKRGWRLEVRLEPTVISGSSSLPYLKAQSQASAYFPFDPKGRTVIAGRLKVGSILGGAIPDVPASRRFYAGGGGSVRGYTYQAIGPQYVDNTPQGGLGLAEFSAELRQKIGPNWGLVGFVDGGSIGSSQIPDGKNLGFGAGIGMRYDLGFGPIRVDLAVPLNPRSNDPSFQIYMSIGQSF